ncbi:MAG TPA: alpha/beta hydrolase, partial [Anaerolineae bacterium]
MAGELQITLLGGVQIARDTVPITELASAKAQALLAYLAITGRPHTRDALAGLLWGEMPDADAR